MLYILLIIGLILFIIGLVKDELGKPIHSAPFWEKNLSEVVEIIKEKLKEYETPI